MTQGMIFIISGISPLPIIHILPLRDPAYPVLRFPVYPVYLVVLERYCRLVKTREAAPMAAPGFARMFS